MNKGTAMNSEKQSYIAVFFFRKYEREAVGDKFFTG